MTYKKQGDYPNALKYFNKMLKITTKGLGGQDPATAVNYANMAEVYKSQNDLKNAIVYFLRSYAILYHKSMTDLPLYYSVKNDLKNAYEESGISSIPFEIWLKGKLKE